MPTKAYKITRGPLHQFNLWGVGTIQVMLYIEQALGDYFVSYELSGGKSGAVMNVTLITRRAISLEKLVAILEKGNVGDAVPEISGPTVIAGCASSIKHY